MNVLTAPRCVLEPQTARHASEMFEVLSDLAIYEFENEPPGSEDALRSRFQQLESRRSSDGTELWLNWVVRVPDGRLAGYVQATVDRDERAYVGYVLNSRYWRQGIASSAVEAMLGELRQHYGVQWAVAVLKDKNFRSEGLLVKLGFHRAAPADEARYRDDDDEIAFIKRLGRVPTAPAPRQQAG